MVQNIHPEYQYLNLLTNILDNGGDYEPFVSQDMKQLHYVERDVPTCRGLFGAMMEFDLIEGFPLFTTKFVHFKSIYIELLWLLRGSGNIKFLVDNNVGIWNEWGWQKYLSLSHKETPGEKPLNLDEYVKRVRDDSDFARKYANLGSAYPVNWRHFKGAGEKEVDQIQWVINGLKNDPTRRHYVVSAWHPCYTYEMANEGEAMALPPCHTTFHFKVNTQGRLDCSLFQRSADMFLGIPFNVASYSLLTHMIAQVCDLPVGKFVHFLSDYHIYSNHFKQCQEQVTREPLPFCGLVLDPTITNIDDFNINSFSVENYQYHPSLKGEVTPVGGV